MNLKLRAVQGATVEEVNLDLKKMGVSDLDQVMHALSTEIVLNHIEILHVSEVDVDLNAKKVRVVSDDGESVFNLSQSLDSLFGIYFRRKEDKLKFQQLFPDKDQRFLRHFTNVDFEHFKGFYEAFGGRENEAILIKSLLYYGISLKDAGVLNTELETLSGSLREETLKCFVVLVGQYGVEENSMEIACELAKKNFSEAEIKGLLKLGLVPEQIVEMSLEEAREAITFKVDLPLYEGHASLLKGYLESIHTWGEDPDRCRAITLASTMSPHMEEVMLAKEFVVAPDWECFVARRDEVVKFYNSDQQQYGTLMRYLTHDLSDKLKEGKISATSLLSQAATGRRAIGYFFHRHDAEKIGKEKKGELFTDCSIRSIYQDLGRKLLDVYHKLLSERHPAAGWESLAIGLSSFSIQTDLLRHADPQVSVEVMKRVKKELIPKILAETDRGQLIKQAGEIFWWICQAKPWDLGDPSIAEVFVKSILLSKGIDLGMWKKGIMPWEEATLALDATSFGQLFPTLFEKTL